MEMLKKLKLGTAIIAMLFIVPVVLVAQQVDSLIAEQIGEIAGNISGIVTVGLMALGVTLSGLANMARKKIAGFPDSIMMVVSFGIQGLSQFLLGLLGEAGFGFLDAIPKNILDFGPGSFTLIAAWLGATGSFHLYKKIKPSP